MTARLGLVTTVGRALTVIWRFRVCAGQRSAGWIAQSESMNASLR